MTAGELGTTYFAELVAVVSELRSLFPFGGVFKSSLAVERTGGIGEIAFPSGQWLELYNPGNGWRYTSSRQVAAYGSTRPVAVESREHVRALAEADLAGSAWTGAGEMQHG